MHRLVAGLLAYLVTVAPSTVAGQAPQLPSRDAGAFLDSIRTELKLPGLAVIVVRSDGEPRIYVSGVRRWGGDDLIQTTDRMHLGSNGKAITGTLIGALVEQKRMTFETTVSEVFPELVTTMRPEYRAVTVRQLMGHAAGIHPYTDLSEFGSFRRSTRDTTGQRLAFAKRILSEKPLFPPGSKHVYSNAGVALVGIMAERVTGRPYEALVDSLVFRPLGARARWGNPGLDSSPQPMGHAAARSGIKVIPATDEDYVMPPVIVPAGDASPTLGDYARFLQMHLRGLRGRDDGLESSTIQELHAAIAPADTAVDWAFGWGVVIRDGVRTHGHSGSAGAYIAITAIQPSKDVAIAFMTNIGGDGVLAQFSKLRPRLQQRLVASVP
jgi:CubicO group peptidase (beta-lactamase class C family)